MMQNNNDESVFVINSLRHFSDHPRSGVAAMRSGIQFQRCLSVCHTITFEHRKFIFAHAVYLQGIQVKFVYEYHRVKVKVTGAKKVRNSIPAIQDFDRQTKFACSTGFSTMTHQMV